MKKIELEIIAISHSISQNQNYAVVLGEQKGERRLPIVIGAFEAQAIAVAMERMVPSRPLTHDLMRNLLETFDIELKEVVINNLLDGIFYASLVCIQNGKTIEVDSRTSDAMALAVRFGAPIFTFDFILDAAGVTLEESGGERSQSANEPPARRKSETASLKNYSLEDLEEMLNEVLSKEDYEQAAKIRDELNRRKSS